MLQYKTAAHIDLKGYGVFTTVPIKRGEFLLEYHGEHISQDEGLLREQSSNVDEIFIYFFQVEGKTYW